MTTELSLKTQCLTVLQMYPGKRFTGSSMAENIVTDGEHVRPASVQSAMSRGYIDCTDGWDFVHRTEATRPTEYWYDPVIQRVAEPDNNPAGFAEGALTIVGVVAGTLLCRDEDGTLYTAKKLEKLP